jgi:hypothetical protein
MSVSTQLITGHPMIMPRLYGRTQSRSAALAVPIRQPTLQAAGLRRMTNLHPARFNWDQIPVNWNQIPVRFGEERAHKSERRVKVIAESHAFPS